MKYYNTWKRRVYPTHDDYEASQYLD